MVLVSFRALPTCLLSAILIVMWGQLFVLHQNSQLTQTQPADSAFSEIPTEYHNYGVPGLGLVWKETDDKSPVERLENGGFYDCPVKAYVCYQQNRTYTNELLKHIWTDERTGLPADEFNFPGFWKTVQSKNMLIMGDSVQMQFANAVLCSLYLDVDSAEIDVLEMKVDKNNPDKIGRIGWKIQVPKYNFTLHAYRESFFEIDLMPPLLESSDIVVLNHGPWAYHQCVVTWYARIRPICSKKDEEEIIKHYYDKWVRLFKSLLDLRTENNALKNQRVFVRFNVNMDFVDGIWEDTGHCNFRVPRDSSFSEKNSTEMYSSLWVTLSQNLQMLRASSDFEFVEFIDTYEISRLRIDAHVNDFGQFRTTKPHDCTHWCLSVVPRLWAGRFSQMLAFTPSTLELQSRKSMLIKKLNFYHNGKLYV